jgi:hypothetical protein
MRDGTAQIRNQLKALVFLNHFYATSFATSRAFYDLQILLVDAIEKLESDYFFASLSIAQAFFASFT